GARRPLAHRMNKREPMSAPSLPFELPAISAGYAELTGSSRAVGERLARSVSSALSSQLGRPVRVSGRPLPGKPGSAVGCARVAFELPALPATAVLEVEAGLVARIVDRLAGGDGTVAG